MQICCGNGINKLPNISKNNVNSIVNLKMLKNNEYSIKISKFTLLGADNEKLFDGAVHNNPQLYFSRTDTINKLYLVLTCNERKIILSQLFNLQPKIYCFEELYPYLLFIRYLPNAVKNFKFLQRITKKYEIIYSHGYIDHYTRKFFNKTVKKLKTKSSLDSIYAFYQAFPYQEASKLKEERPDKIVLALDFNSMYASVMLNEYPDPRRLTYKKFQTQLQKSNDLPLGIYKVILKKPKTEFICNYHPFKFSLGLKNFSFNLSSDNSILTLLHKNEICYYSKHFNEILIIDALVSDRLINHPLAYNVKNFYAQRMHYKSQNNTVQEKLFKLLLSSMYSCVKRNLYTTIKTDTFDSLIQEFGKKFYFDLNSSHDLQQIKSLISYCINFNYNKYNFKLIPNKFSFTTKDIHSPFNIFSLYTQVLAYAKIKILSVLEHVNSFKGAEICYCNIDSIHVSIPTHKKHEFLDYISPYIDGKLGFLKLEACSEHGIWIQPGRYWLYNNDGKVVKYSNVGLNSRFNKNPFITHTKYLKVLSLAHSNKNIPIYSSFDLNNSLLFDKTLKVERGFSLDDVLNINFERFKADDICTLEHQLSTINNEILNSKEIRLAIFSAIMNKLNI